jgi:hypothetical protein
MKWWNKQPRWWEESDFDKVCEYLWGAKRFTFIDDSHSFYNGKWVTFRNVKEFSGGKSWSDLIVDNVFRKSPMCEYLKEV